MAKRKTRLTRLAESGPESRAISGFASDEVDVRLLETPHLRKLLKPPCRSQWFTGDPKAPAVMDVSDHVTPAGDERAKTPSAD